MRIKTHSSVAVIAISAAAMFALAGCSAGTSTAHKSSASPSPSASSSAPAPSSPAAAGGAQTVVEGCTVLANALKDSTATLKASFTALSADPSKALTGLDAFAKTFDSGLSQVSNADVQAVAAKADASLKSMNSLLAADVKTPASADVPALQTAITTFQTDFTAIGTVCS